MSAICFYDNQLSGLVAYSHTAQARYDEQCPIKT
jgi:hypothetical protein